jgi:hypothetical protein
MQSQRHSQTQTCPHACCCLLPTGLAHWQDLLIISATSDQLRFHPGTLNVSACGAEQHQHVALNAHLHLQALLVADLPLLYGAARPQR